MSKKVPSFEIALSAMACAISVLFLSLGVISPYFQATGYIAACFALMLPLTKGFVAGDVAAYLATIILTFFFGGASAPWRMLPFVLIFGLHPLVNHLQIRHKWNVLLMLVIKSLWFDGSLFLIWWLLFDCATNFAWIDRLIVPVILVGGTAFFIVYDKMIFRCQHRMNEWISRLKK